MTKEQIKAITPSPGFVLIVGGGETICNVDVEGLEPEAVGVMFGRIKATLELAVSRIRKSAETPEVAEAFDNGVAEGLRQSPKQTNIEARWSG